MILIIDNFDSFTYNIAQCLEKAGHQIMVKRNNEITLNEIETLSPSHLIISPGPGKPSQAGISLEVVKHFQGKIPILGVCLGHQCIAQSLGGKIASAKKLYHGKVSSIKHDGNSLYTNLPNPLIQTRYHSLVVDKKSMPDDLFITAVSEDGEIMGIRHKEYILEGVQFHPESIASEHGETLLNNFITPPKPLEAIKNKLKKLHQKKDLTQSEAEYLMSLIAEGVVSPSMTAALLTALSMKGERVDEIAGFAKVMRQKATFIQAPKGKLVVDTCGTGGDKSGTFNISTITAIVVAGAGVHVAKHGNRSITSNCGSADLFEELGVNLDVPVGTMERALKEARLAFLFAGKLHEAMKHVIHVRKELAIPTIFNILGPLTNPANAKYQVMGVFDKRLTKIIVQVMKQIGIERGLVVHGSDGLDEITLTGKTYVAELRGGEITHYTLSPSDVGLKNCTSQDLLGGNPQTNARICQAILNGEKGPRTDIVLLNAGAVLYTCGRTNDIKEGIQLANTSITSGAAKRSLEKLISISNY